MKKILLAIICSACSLVYADIDLREKNFSKPANGTAEIVSLGWLEYGLKITATAESDAEIVYNRLFNYYPGMFYEVNGDFSGQGEILVKLYFFNQDGTPYKVAVKTATVRKKVDEFTARFDLREFTSADAPYQFKVVVGVKKGGSIILDDMELEIDED